MIVSKNNSGFTLIEAMLAIALIAIAMTPLLITQGSVVQAVARVSARVQRIFFAQNFFIEGRAEAGDETKFSLDKKIDAPSTIFSFERKSVDSKSSLAKIKHVVIDRVKASWEDESKKQKEVVVSVQYIKPQSES